MKLVRGPRPLAIRVFAAAFLAAALLRLARPLGWESAVIDHREALREPTRFLPAEEGEFEEEG